MDESKRETRHELQALVDIYKFDKQIKQALSWLITPGVKAE